MTVEAGAVTPVPVTMVVTTAPPLRAVPDKVILQVLEVPPCTAEGLQPSEETVGTLPPEGVETVIVPPVPKADRAPPAPSTLKRLDKDAAPVAVTCVNVSAATGPSLIVVESGPVARHVYDPGDKLPHEIVFPAADAADPSVALMAPIAVEG